MDGWLITFFIGAILSLFMAIVPEFFYVIFFTGLGLACLLYQKTRTISGLFLGIAWILYSGVQYQQVWQKNNIDVNTLFNSTHFVTGKVKTIPATIELDLPIEDKNKEQLFKNKVKNKIKYKRNYKFNFEITHIDHQVLPTPLITRLSWNKSSKLIQQGNEWFLKVKLKPPHGFANRGGFNYQMWLRQNNIVATGYVINHKHNERVNNKNSYRQQLYSHSLTLLPPGQLSSLLTALSFGERSTIDQATWLVLNKTNTQHLIAISGLHLGLIATGSFLIISFLIKYIPLRYFFKSSLQSPNVDLLLSKNSKLIAVLFSCLIAFYYAYLAGFSLPTVRALVMLLFFWGFRMIGVKPRLLTWLFLTVFIVLLLTPMSLISGSFWLSFYAVSLILLTVWRFQQSFTGKSKLITWLKSLFWVQLSLSIFMLPISMLFNYQLSLVSIAANLIAVPLMSFTSIPLCLLAVLVMPFSDLSSLFLYQLASFTTEILWHWLVILSEQPWALVNVSFSHILVGSIIISIIGGSRFLSVKWKYLSVISFFCLVVFYYIHFFNNQNRDWKVTVLDVGQGLSIVVEKNNKAILYDTGASYPSGFNMVEAAILPYLKYQGIHTLDKVIISHSDNDHAGGLNKLKELLNIKKVIASDPVLKGDEKCTKDGSFIWQDLSFSVLWPSNEMNYVGDENDHSCVIKISDGSKSVLLTGDISTRVEKLLVANFEVLPVLNSDVIIAPHHGSNTSSSQAFIEAVSPRYVVYSSGFMNRWNMPSTLVQKRYDEKGVLAFNTAEHGMVEIKVQLDKFNEVPHNSNNKRITVTPYKRGIYPFWFAQ
ncbi:DNA internalization-related competence protein ComEC/Rec2 [Pseudocolwellia agarivorans]|uniref:DNA internalization-related competence protein ComEC/Rec2 n=1 Tax=Pseudocolwellia agarivorans TaxID=1911682 RepID=UPI0009841EDD|nr:DNA internalization-related competence protein ComEC/Rec2 [Pseudocolwellia agarivorans]